MALLTCACAAPAGAAASVFSFRTLSPLYAPPSQFGQGESLVTGDFNHDGKQDVAFSSSSDLEGSSECPFNYESSGQFRVLEDGCVSVLLGEGNGAFELGPPAVAAGLEFPHNPADYPTGGSPAPGPSALASGQLTEDGSTDLVVANESGGPPCGSEGCVAILYGNPDGTFQQPSVTVPVMFSGSPVAVLVGHFTASGREDIAVAASGASGGHVYILENTGTAGGRAQFALAQEVPLAAQSSPWAMTVADMQGSGTSDLVLSTEGTLREHECDTGCVQVLTRNGATGKLNTPVAYEVAGWGQIAAASLRGAATDDVVVADGEAGGYQVLLNKGEGSLEAPVRYGSPGTEETRGLAVDDFDNDGKLDVAIAGNPYPGGPPGHTLLFDGSGEGAFTYDTAATDAEHLQGRDNALASSELNGGCKPDLVVGSSAGVQEEAVPAARASVAAPGLEGGALVMLNETGGAGSACPPPPPPPPPPHTTTTTTTSEAPKPKLEVKSARARLAVVHARIAAAGLPVRCTRAGLHVRFTIRLRPRKLARQRTDGRPRVRVHTVVRLDGRRIGSSRRRSFTLDLPLGKFGVGRNTLTVTTTGSGKDVRRARRVRRLRFSRCLPAPKFTG